MSQEQIMVARITCPNCQNPFQTPVEQILDVGTDPSAKMRVLNGMVNVVVCPNCGFNGPLNLPFLYHDPEKELALVHMPMEAGRDDIERQQAIGQLTGTVMESLPAEERKGYLLQPQVFFTLENLRNRVLEEEGITPEMIEEQKAKAQLLRRMLDATSDKVLEAMIKENDETIDDEFFAILSMNMEIAQATGEEQELQHLLDMRGKLLELSTTGRVAKERSDKLETLRAEPTRGKLLELLIQSPDERTREALITFGRPLLDYPFFQSLTSRIESTSDEGEKKQLQELRKEILGVRDRLDEEARAMLRKRQELVRDLMLSDDPETLARRRFQELDQAFFNVLGLNIEQAEKAGNADAVESLQTIWDMTLGLMEETLPLDVRLLNLLMGVEDDAEALKLLEQNSDLVTERLVEILEQVESKMEEEGEAPEAAERLKMLLDRAREIIGE